MKHYLRNCIAIGSLFLTISLLPSAAWAQTNPADPMDDPDLPIDGGVSLLIAAGVGYGIKKYKDERNKKQQQVDKG
ncbi:hypothetical protein BH11BAC3_BH11BAC3_34820 [soil metagenome]